MLLAAQVHFWSPDFQNWWPSKNDRFLIKGLIETLADTEVDTKDWLKEIKHSGNGVGEQPEWLVEIESGCFHNGLYPEAGSVLDLIEQLHLNGMSRDPEFALPVYLEGDSPWVKVIDR